MILPDVRGLHPFYEELALRFAEHGDRRGRDRLLRADGRPRPRAATTSSTCPTSRRSTWAGLSADIRAAADHLRLGRRAPGRALFTIGFCFGGRLAFLIGHARARPGRGRSASTASRSGPGRADVPAPVDVADRDEQPVLGLFGGADQGIPPETIDAFEHGPDGRPASSTAS